MREAQTIKTRMGSVPSIWSDIPHNSGRWKKGVAWGTHLDGFRWAGSMFRAEAEQHHLTNSPDRLGEPRQGD